MRQFMMRGYFMGKNKQWVMRERLPPNYRSVPCLHQAAAQQIKRRTLAT
jgi:hypothetical protein